jgi:hypothetical protein
MAKPDHGGPWRPMATAWGSVIDQACAWLCPTMPAGPDSARERLHETATQGIIEKTRSVARKGQGHHGRQRTQFPMAAGSRCLRPARVTVNAQNLRYLAPEMFAIVAKFAKFANVKFGTTPSAAA